MSNVKPIPPSGRLYVKPVKDREWLGMDGRFLFGKYKGQLLEEVADIAPHYLRWILDEVDDISDGDREVIAAQLAYRTR